MQLEENDAETLLPPDHSMVAVLPPDHNMVAVLPPDQSLDTFLPPEYLTTNRPIEEREIQRHTTTYIPDGVIKNSEESYFDSSMLPTHTAYLGKTAVLTCIVHAAKSDKSVSL